MTNFEKIIKDTEEEKTKDKLAKELSEANADCEKCPIKEFCPDAEALNCSGTWDEWLSKEVGE